jgi:MGT family glycosyltransferase
MAHFAIVSLDEAGHLLSIGTVGQELVRRGHRVTVMSAQWAEPLAKRLDLPLYLLESESVPYHYSSVVWHASRLMGASVYSSMRDYLPWHADVILRHVPGALRDLGVDGVLVDHVMAAGGTAAEHVGLPFVTVCPALFWNGEPTVPPSYTGWPYNPSRRGQLRNQLGYAGFQWFLKPTLKMINDYRRKWGLATVEHINETYSSLAQIAQLCPMFDFPRQQLPDTFHYIGSLTADRKLNSDTDFPWERLDGRPLVYASLGTVLDRSNTAVFPRLLSSCAQLDVQLVLALGKWSHEDSGYKFRDHLGAIPDNAIVVDFAPQLALLERAAVMITHAGVNTVLEALTRAVPMVALPRSADQPPMASRIVHSGVGVQGSFLKSSPAQIRAMVEQVLSDDSYRRRGRELQAAMRAAGGTSRAADIAEQALLTGRPVTRQSLQAIPSERSLSAAC